MEQASSKSTSRTARPPREARQSRENPIAEQGLVTEPARWFDPLGMNPREPRGRARTPWWSASWLCSTIALCGALVGQEASADPASAGRAARGEVLLGPNSRAVVIGVLHWADPRLRPFDPSGRKDVALAEALVTHAGLPRSSVRLLVDEAATRAAILSVIASAARSTAPGESLVVYYAGHGSRAAGGLITPFDAKSSDLANTAISMTDLEHATSSLPRGARLVLLGDNCNSGALAKVAEGAERRGVLAAAITSADAASVSTSNWTFTQTLVAALTGEPLADRDGDGLVRVNELHHEVRDAMKYLERQRAGGWSRALDDAVVAPVRAPSPPPLPQGLGYAIGSFVRLRTAPSRRARVLGTTPEKLVRIRELTYSSATESSVSPADLEPIRHRTEPVGTRVTVVSAGRTWSAQIAEIDDGFMRVTFPGWDSSWDEWLLEDRVLGRASDVEAPSTAGGVFPPESPVLVQWGGSWWPARVLRATRERWLVHYDGQDSLWDEWVGPERIRAP